MKKLIALLITISMLFSVTVATAGCGGGGTSFGDGDDVVIQFQLDNLGYGTQWLQESCDRFMAQQKDVEYPGGKQGVYCHIVRGNTPTANNIEQSGSHVVFRSGRGETLAETGNVWAIPREVMTQKIPGETKSIEDKLYPESRAFFRAGDTYGENGELIPGDYYTIPSHETYGGLSYDKKVFDNYGFFLARQLDGPVNSSDTEFSVADYEDEFGLQQHVSSLTGETYFFVSPKPDTDVEAWEKGKSCGPNGIYGDYDDGLASSLWELFAMWEFMAAQKISPMLVSGHQKSLANAILDSLPSSLMGYEKARGQYDLTGPVDAVVNFSYGAVTNGMNYIEAPIVQNINVTEETGYYTTWAVERYFTMAAMELLFTEGYLNSSSIPDDPTQVNHLGAQKKFLDSGHQIMGGVGEEIGMLMEYSYWWNESSIRGNVDAFQSLNPDVDDREIRWMPLPVNIKATVTGERNEDGSDIYTSYRFSEQPGISFSRTGTEYTESISGEKNILCQVGWSGFIIGKKAAEMDPATTQAIKDWLLFFHSDAELSAVTASQGFRKGLIYEMSNADRSKWAPFYSDLYDLSEKSDIIRPASDTETFLTGVSTFMSRSEGNMAWQCNHGHYFACWTKPASGPQDRSSRRCFNKITIDRADWGKYYRGGEDTANLENVYLTYPGTNQEIVFVDGDDSKPV